MGGPLLWAAGASPLLRGLELQKMSQTTPKKPQTTPKRRVETVDYTGENLVSWYLDIHLPDGVLLEKVHLFLKDSQDMYFKDFGVVKKLKEDASGLEMSSCIGITLMDGPSYMLDPMAFVHTSLNATDAVTMVQAGWVNLKKHNTNECTISTFIQGFKKVSQYLSKLRSKKQNKRKNEDTTHAKQNKALKDNKAITPNTIIYQEGQEKLSLVPMDSQAIEEDQVTEASQPTIIPSAPLTIDVVSAALLSSIVQPEEKELDKEVAKTSKHVLDGYLGIEPYLTVAEHLWDH